MQKQKTLLSTDKPWAIGDLVVIGDRQYKILRFHPTLAKVQLEFITSDNEKVQEWKPTTDLPANPTVGDSPAVDSLLMHKRGVETSPDTDTPTESDAPTEEIYFEKGHKRINEKTGSTLTVVEPSVKGKYMCRMLLAAGGTFTQEWGWEKIAKWGEVAPDTKEETQEVEVVVPDSSDTPATKKKDDYVLTDDAKAVLEEIDAKGKADAGIPDQRVPTDEVGPRPNKAYTVDFLPVPFVMRDAGGWHHVEAGKELTKHIREGWTLQHVDYQTMWIPARSVQVQSYVEMTVVWTLTRTVEVR